MTFWTAPDALTGEALVVTVTEPLVGEVTEPRASGVTAARATGESDLDLLPTLLAKVTLLLSSLFKGLPVPGMT